MTRSAGVLAAFLATLVFAEVAAAQASRIPPPFDTVAAPTSPAFRAEATDEKVIRLQFEVPAATAALIGKASDGCMLADGIILAGRKGLAFLTLDGKLRWETRLPGETNADVHVACGAETVIALRQGMTTLHSFDLLGTMGTIDLPEIESTTLISRTNAGVLVSGLDAQGITTIIEASVDSGSMRTVLELPPARIRGNVLTAGGAGYFLVADTRQPEIRAYDLSGKLLSGVTWAGGTQLPGPARMKLDQHGNVWVRMLEDPDPWSVLTDTKVWMSLSLMQGFRSLASTRLGELGAIDDATGTRVLLLRLLLPSRAGTLPF